MTKFYTQAKFNNNHKVNYTWLDQVTSKLPVRWTNVLIIRGIGYRAYCMTNDFTYTKNKINTEFIKSTRPIFTGIDLDESEILNQATNFEFPFKRYLIIRAGHNDDLYVPLKPALKCQTSKKDRKLVISSYNKIYASNLCKVVYNYRPPSVYTGRGVRIKHARPTRKAGKKDKQKGRAF